MDIHDHAPVPQASGRLVWWRTGSGLVLLGFLAVAAYFLVTEHGAHLALAVPYLPWLLLLACLPMHFFMHGGHGGHHGHGGHNGHEAPDGPTPSPTMERRT